MGHYFGCVGGVNGALFWVGGGEWGIILSGGGGWENTLGEVGGMSEGGWGCVHCLIMPM